MDIVDQTPLNNIVQSRRNFPRIKVSCSPEEKTEIELNAKRLNLSVSTYLRLLGLGYQPKAPVAMEAVEALIDLRADNSRLGNLFYRLQKSTLSFLKNEIGEARITILIEKIEENSYEISSYLKQLHRQHSNPKKGDF